MSDNARAGPSRFARRRIDANDPRKREHLYAVREGHFLGFFLGVLLAHWPWVAFAWFVLIAALWLGSLFEQLTWDSAKKNGVEPW